MTSDIPTHLRIRRHLRDFAVGKSEATKALVITLRWQVRIYRQNGSPLARDAIEANLNLLAAQ